MNDRPKTILVIDNDPGVVHALSTRLESIGFIVLTAGTGAQGLAEFDRGDVDLVISDLNMPHGDGVTFAEAVRKVSNVPIIFVSGYRDDFKKRLRTVSDVTVLQKPFSTESLIELVEMELALTPAQSGTFADSELDRAA